MAEKKHVGNNREIYTPNYERVSFCEVFQVLVLKQFRLAFVMYFFKFHTTLSVIQRYKIFKLYLVKEELINRCAYFCVKLKNNAISKLFK